MSVTELLRDLGRSKCGLTQIVEMQLGCVECLRGNSTCSNHYSRANEQVESAVE